MMKVHKIVLLASISMTPMQELLAVDTSHGGVVQRVTATSTIAIPTKKLILNKTSVPLSIEKLGVITTGKKVVAPKYQSNKLRKIVLFSNQQLLLTNGKSIVRNGSSGIDFLEANKEVIATYKNASLFKDNKKLIWIKTKNSQNSVGILSRIKTLKITPKPLVGLVGTRHVGKLEKNKVSGTSTVRADKINSNATLHNYEQSPDRVQGNTGGSISNGSPQHEKSEAQDLELFVAEPKKFALFNVISDSVVATAVVTVDENHRTLIIDWGDGVREKVILYGFRTTITDANTTNQSNAFRFKHVYSAPVEGTKKVVTIWGKNSDGRVTSRSGKSIDINARYKFSMYSVILEFPDHLDSSFESNSEVEGHMTVKQGGQVLYDRRWKKSILTAPSVPTENAIEWRLPQSGFSREIASFDENFEINLFLEEIDGVGKSSSILGAIWGVASAPFKGAQHVYEFISAASNFDGSNILNRADMPLKIHPDTTISSSNSNKANVVFSMGTREGNIIAHFSYDLKLIVPTANPSNGSVIQNY